MGFEIHSNSSRLLFVYQQGSGRGGIKGTKRQRFRILFANQAGFLTEKLLRMCTEKLMMSQLEHTKLFVCLSSSMSPSWCQRSIRNYPLSAKSYHSQRRPSARELQPATRQSPPAVLVTRMESQARKRCGNSVLGLGPRIVAPTVFPPGRTH